MRAKNIVLTGFMGTGKTTVGRLLAARLERDFVDTDEIIVARSGRTIAEIFREEGEVAFRRWEAAVAQELAAGDSLVIATGGRLLLDAGNAAALSHNGLIFCLTADVDEIMARLQKDEIQRPLLAVSDPRQKMQQLLAERAEGYGRFPQIDTTGKTAAQIMEEIVRCIFVT